ncbi:MULTISPECIES: PTS sugar transporter subunit IIC [Oenococcus]|uniref:Permease IIC component n=2 Tax=Oenococcus TaxID=46254 RepID=G9WJD3_9LACO|nr:PTS transporter subunit EIIC [Oenococcus kitaharae]EHN58739.1 PTS system cellobiose-specific IIC component [Oenococcus kitaharae DSM 17330]OEY81909.1 oligo-beta-mannoside permease IIC protein [Oenococcus kitaharae]OEY82299.1 oligo-beta-mannoside permease IIC protein [Oenococcus kitaharae]OEY82525.1 oligo-beta-mannoside permease IIC protein [Oenococcus kitaharae]
MEKFMQSFQTRMSKIAIKLDGNRYLSAIKNAFIAAMPILIVGSFFILLANLPIPAYAGFMRGIFGTGWQRIFNIPYNISMNLMSIYIVVEVANEMAGSYHLNKISAIFSAMAAFFVVTPMYTFKNGTLGIGIPMNNLSASGLFVAMIVSILAVEILHFVDKHGWKIKMPDAVPTNVSESFSSLIPLALVVIIFNLVRIIFEQTSFGSIQSFIFTNLQTPLTILGSSLPATILVLLIEGLLWSFGIHGANVVGSVMTPIWLALTAQNAAAFAAGKAIPNIVNYQFYNNFIKIGGSGATFGLCLLLLFFAHSKQFKAIGRLAIGPEIFTINEPIIFGLPIVLNPLMVIPFILNPIIMALVAYISMRIGLVPLTNGVNIPWTTPPIIAGFLVSGWRGAVLNIVQILISVAVYLPFFKTADKLAVDAENKKAAEEAAKQEVVGELKSAVN